MSVVEINRQIARRVFDEVWSQGNLDAVDTLYTENFVEHGTPPWIISGGSDFKHWISPAVAGFPYKRLAIEELFASGDKVAARYVVLGCTLGSAVSHRIEYTEGVTRGAVVMRFSSGRVAEAWGTARLLTLLSSCE